MTCPTSLDPDKPSHLRHLIKVYTVFTCCICHKVIFSLEELNITLLSADFTQLTLKVPVTVAEDDIQKCCCFFLLFFTCLADDSHKLFSLKN